MAYGFVRNWRIGRRCAECKRFSGSTLLPSRAAVEPAYALIRLLWRAAAEHLVTQFGRRTARVIEVAIDARHDLHARGAQITLVHISPERARQVVRALRHAIGQRDSVFCR